MKASGQWQKNIFVKPCGLSQGPTLQTCEARLQLQLWKENSKEWGKHCAHTKVEAGVIFSEGKQAANPLPPPQLLNFVLSTPFAGSRAHVLLGDN